MKALILPSASAGQPVWAEIDEPTVRNGEVLVLTSAAGLDDRFVRRMSAIGHDVLNRPSVLGEMATGVVLAIGDGVQDVAAGDAVLIRSEGACSTRISVPARHAHLLPGHLDLARAAGLADFLLAQSILTDGIAGIEEPRIWIRSLTSAFGQALAFLAPDRVKLLSGDPAISAEKADLVIDFEAGPQFGALFAGLADFGRILICGRRQGSPAQFFDTLWTNLDRCPEMQIWTLERYTDHPERFREILAGVLDAIDTKGWPASIMVEPLSDAPRHYAEALDEEPGAGVVFSFAEAGQ